MFDCVLRTCVAVVLALTVAGCSMVGSSPIERMNAIGCSSDAGAYYLSKTYFEIEIEKWGLFPPAAADKPARPVRVWYEVKQVAAKRKPDREFGYCLDYLSSPTADEKVWVRKDADYLLSLISTQSIDQSAYIAKAIIGTLFRGIAIGQARALTPGLVAQKIETAFKGEYDPLDRAQSAVINGALKQLGFCMVLENETFDARALSINAYCNDPRLALAERSEKARPAKAAGNDAVFKGIAYRPRVPYNYYLFVRDVAKGQASWKLRQSESITLESRATVINVGIDRTFFANRRTALIFDQGALKNICIYKSSELAELATIPLAIAKNVAALPANVMQLRIDNTNNFQKLATVESALIKAQQADLELLQGGTSGAERPASAPVVDKTPFTFDAIGTPKTAAAAFAAVDSDQTWAQICPADVAASNPAAASPANLSIGSVVTAQPLGPTP